MNTADPDRWRMMLTQMTIPSPIRWRYLRPLPMTRPPIRRKHSSKRPIKTRLVRRPTAVINQSLWPIQLTRISGATAAGTQEKKAIQMIRLCESSYFPPDSFFTSGTPKFELTSTFTKSLLFFPVIVPYRNLHGIPGTRLNYNDLLGINK